MPAQNMTKLCGNKGQDVKNRQMRRNNAKSATSKITTGVYRYSMDAGNEVVDVVASLKAK